MRRLELLSATFLALAIPATPISHGQQLPPDIQVDRLLVQAERETASGDHWSAAITLEGILEIHEEHGLESPAEFWFRQAGVLHSAGLDERAIEASTRYLKEAGRDGKHYQAALELLDAALEAVDDARHTAEAERLRIERERQAKLAQQRICRQLFYADTAAQVVDGSGHSVRFVGIKRGYKVLRNASSWSLGR